MNLKFCALLAAVLLCLSSVSCLAWGSDPLCFADQPLYASYDDQDHLKISIITTKRAYEDLERDGYIVSVTGKGGLDYDKVGDEVCGLARQLVQDNPDIGAILLECTDMPPYAHRIQAELGLPVYDAITLIRYAKSVVTQTPYYGFL